VAATGLVSYEGMAQKTSGMKTYAFIVTVLLLLSGGAIWYLIDRNKAEQANRYGDNLRLQGVIESVRDEAAANLALAADTIQALRHELTSRVAFQDSVSASLLSEISGHKRTIAILRPLAQPALDSNPDLSDLVTTQDITIGLQDSLINAQELFCADQVRDLEQIIRIQGQQTTQALALAEAEKQRGDEQERAKNGEVKKRKFWRFAAAVAAGVAVIVSLVGK
jgi:hypothetical protein